MINYSGRIVPERADRKQWTILGYPIDRLLISRVLGVVVGVGLGVSVAYNIAGSYYVPTMLQMVVIFLAVPISPIFVLRPRLTLWTLLIFGNFLFYLNRFA